MLLCHLLADPVIFSEDFDLANDMAVELGKFFSGNPILAMYAGTCNLDRKVRDILGLDLETQHITGAAISRIPIAGNLDGIFFFKHGIENRLLR